MKMNYKILAALGLPFAVSPSAMAQSQELKPLVGLHGEGRAYVVGCGNVPYDATGLYLNIPSTMTVGGKKVVVDSIGEGAFQSIEGLESVTIPSSVRGIAKDAFNRCTSLKNLTLSEGVEYIGEHAFYDCSGLSVITLPKSLKYIHPEALWNSGLKRIEVAPGNKHYKSVDGVLYTADGKTLVRIPQGFVGELTVADGTERLGEASCRADGLTGIRLPQSLREIGESAFLWDTELMSIAIPEGVVRIGRTALGQCDKLKEVVLPETATDLAGNIFYSCDNLSKMTLPKALTAIPATMFEDCANLKSFELADNVKEIGDYAFSGTGFEKFTLPAGIERLGKNPWRNCPELLAIELDESNKSYMVSNGALYSLKDLSLVSVPGGLIGEMHIDDGVKKIDDEALYFCKLNYVVIPEGVEEIGEGAFQFMDNIQEITLPASVRVIGDNAFANGSFKRIIINSTDMSQVGNEIADANCTIYMPESGITNFRKLAEQSDAETAERLKGMEFLFGDSQSRYAVRPLSELLPDRVLTPKDLATYPIGIPMEGDVWNMTAYELGNKLDSMNIPYSYSTDGPNVINVSNEFMIDLSQLGKTGITNQLALFGEDKLIGWMIQLKMADSSLIAPYSVLLTQLLKDGGFEVHEGLKTKQIVKYGNFMLCGTKGDTALLFFCNDYGVNNFLITKFDSPFLQSLQNRN